MQASQKISPSLNILRGLRANPDFGVGPSAVILSIQAFTASLGSPVLIWPTHFGFTFRKEIPFQKRDLALAPALSKPAGGRPRLVRAALAEPVEAGLVMDDSLGTFRRGLSLQSWRLFLVTFLCS